MALDRWSLRNPPNGYPPLTLGDEAGKFARHVDERTVGEVEDELAIESLGERYFL